LPALDDPEASRLRSLPPRDLSRLTERALGEHFDEPFIVEVAGSLQQLTLQGARLFEDLS
jgi:hypothetical protein